MLHWSFEHEAAPVKAEIKSGEMLRREALSRQAKELPGNERRSEDSFTEQELKEIESPEARRGDMTDKTSQVLYRDIVPGVTARYTLSGDQVKEDIVCETKEALSVVSLKLPTEYDYVVNADQSMSVRDKQSGVERFYFDMPVVYDAMGMTVIGSVNVEEKEDYIRLSYGIDPEFLKVCAWPVTIDPVTKYRATKNGMESVVLHWASDGDKDKSANPSSLKVRRSKNKEGEYLSLLRLTRLAAIKASDTVISAKLKFTITNAKKTKGKYVGIYEVDQDWTTGDTASSLIGTFMDRNSDREITIKGVKPDMLDYAAGGKSSISFDITGLYRDWYRVEKVNKKSMNRGILLRSLSAPAVMTIGAPGNSTEAKRPQFVVNYISHAGLESWWKYESQSAGRAGTTHVDLFNGNVVHEHVDTAMSGNRLPVSITHYYNSCQSTPDSRDRGNKDPNDPWPTYNEMYRCGHGWKHSGLQHIYQTKVNASTYYVWVDGDGTEHWFKIKDKKKKLTNDQELYDVEGMGLKLTYKAAKGDASEKLEIEDKSNIVMTFRRRMSKKRKGTWRCWWLTSLHDQMRGTDDKWTNIVRYEYHLPEGKDLDDKHKMRMMEGKLKSIKDPVGRITRFYYNESNTAFGANMLCKIEAPNFVNGGMQDTDFVYDDLGRLATINYMELESADFMPPHTRYEYYDGTNLLKTAFNYEGTRVAIQYEDCDLNADFFDLPEEEDDDGTQESDDPDATPTLQEYTGKIGYDLCRVSALETIREDSAKGTARGARQLFDYKSCLTTVTVVEGMVDDPANDKKIIYQFNDKGNVISVRDQLGYAQFVKFEDDSQENKPTSASGTQRSVINRINKPGLLKDMKTLDPAWEMSTPQNEASKSNKNGNKIGFDFNKNRCLGLASMMMDRHIPDSGSSESMWFKQTVTLEKGDPLNADDMMAGGKRWTLSCYVKANHIERRVNEQTMEFYPDDGAFMRVTIPGVAEPVKISEVISGSSEDAFSDNLPTDGWERLRMCFTTPMGTNKDEPMDITVEFVLRGKNGSVYFAAPQLEAGAVSNHVNLLTNGDFYLIKTEKAEKPNLSDHVARTFPQYWSADKGIQKEKLNKKKTKVTTKADYRIGVFDPFHPEANLHENPYDLPGNDYDPFLPVLSGKYLQIRNGVQNKSMNAWFHQEVLNAGKKGDVFYAGGWASGKAMPKSASSEVRGFRFMIQFYCKNKKGNWGWKTGKGGKHHFNQEWVGWQMQSGAAIAPEEYARVRVLLVCKGQPVFTKFTNFFLYREEFGRSYSYDKNGNVVTTSERNGQQSGVEYDSFFNVTSYRKPGRPKKEKYKLTYGSSDRLKKQHLLRSTKTPLGMSSTTDYDKYGNVTGSAVKQKGGSQKIQTKTAYSASYNDKTGAKVSLNTDGNFAVMKADARGNSAYMSVNKNTGLLEWADDPNLTRVQYNYDSLKRLTGVSAAVDEGTYHNRYKYDQSGRMIEVSHNAGMQGAETDVKYHFDYDALGAQTTVSVGNQTLSTNVYDGSARSHKLLRSEFANGGWVKNEYDEFDRVVATTHDGTTVDGNPFRYEYEFGANGQTAFMRDRALRRTHFTEYDMAGRPCQSTTWDGICDAENPTERGKLRYRATLKYDKFSRLALFGERVPGKDKPVRLKNKDGSWKVENGQPVYGPEDDDGTDNITTKYTYDDDDRTLKITYDEKEEERSVKYEYDGLGRIKGKIVRNGGDETIIDPEEQGEDDEEYTGNLNHIKYEYEPGADSKAATPLVSRIFHNAINRDLSYEYDTVGNILNESCDLQGNANSYEYDALGQLIAARVRNDAQTSGDSINGTRWEYEYDLGGNILKKTPFKMDTQTGEWVAMPEKAVAYEYGNANWADQMTAYDGQPIEYDAIGNPLTCGDTTFEWQGGRKLMKLSRSGSGYRQHGRLKVNADMSISQVVDGPQSFAIVDGDLTSSQNIYALSNGDVTTLGAGDDLTVEFRYDASGLRTQKKVTENGVTATTDYYLHGKLLMHLKKTTDGAADPEELHFYYDAQSRPIMLKYGVGEKSEYFTYVHNLQGDILGILDRNQNLVVEYQYDPWGKPLNTLPKETADPALNALYANLATLNPFRYRGYLFDDETGLYYLRSRYYSPEMGRFLCADVGIQISGAVFGANSFMYCFNNPASYVDHDGNLANRTIHDAVVKYITDNNYYMLKEVEVILPSGGRGKIDLYDWYSGEIWEVKRIGLSYAAARRQLDNYKKSLVLNPLLWDEDAPMREGGYVPPGSFVFENGGEEYLVVYAYISHGIIMYDYKRMEDEKQRRFSYIHDRMMRVKQKRDNIRKFQPREERKPEQPVVDEGIAAIVMLLIGALYFVGTGDIAPMQQSAMVFA